MKIALASPPFPKSLNDGLYWLEKLVKEAAIEKAEIICENTIYFASSNFASLYPESASSIISPDGTCIIHETYGHIGVVVADIDPELATGLLAKRFNPAQYS